MTGSKAAPPWSNTPTAAIELIHPSSPVNDTSPDVDAASSQHEEPAFAELIRSDRGLDHADQWKVTLGGPAPGTHYPVKLPPRPAQGGAARPDETFPTALPTEELPATATKNHVAR